MVAATYGLLTRAAILAQEEHGAEESKPEHLYPHAQELIIAAIAFTILFVFMARFVIPRMNKMLDERRSRIQGEMEKAEGTRQEADQILEQYRAQLANAREEANRIIEDARQTAEAMRRDLAEKAERESQQIVARAQDEIRAERERAFNDLRTQVGELSVELATRVVGESLDRERQLRMVDQYIDELSRQGGSSGEGTGQGGDEGRGGGG